MSYKHSIELKVYSVSAGKAVPNKSNEVSASVLKAIENGQQGQLVMGPRASFITVKKQLESVGHIVRSGISGGCYGARDGKTHDGLTVFADATQFPERFKNSDGDEIVNPYSLIENMGGELIEGLDGDVFTEACEDLGCDIRRDNSFNYEGRDSSNPHFLVDIDFAVILNKENGAAFLAVKFHCGGDIRENYTERVVFKFSSIDDLYGAIFPTCELNDGGES